MYQTLPELRHKVLVAEGEFELLQKLISNEKGNLINLAIFGKMGGRMWIKDAENSIKTLHLLSTRLEKNKRLQANALEFLEREGTNGDVESETFVEPRKTMSRAELDKVIQRGRATRQTLAAEK